MATILSDTLQACDDCAIAIANGDYTGMDGATEQCVKDALGRWAKQGCLVVGEELGFSWHGCDICDSDLGGNVHQVSLLGERDEI